MIKRRAQAVRNNIDTRHAKKLGNLYNEFIPSPNLVDKSNWVVNLSKATSYCCQTISPGKGR